MDYHDHSRELSRLPDHATFSASKPSWTHDRNAEEALQRYYNSFATEIGTVVHELARDCIRTNTRYTKDQAKKEIRKQLMLYRGRIDPGTGDWVNYIPTAAYNLNSLAANFVNFVNDAIGFMMRPEVPLYHSELCFGTTDAIIFDSKKKLLRIHDLKTGVTPAKFEQLEIYAAYYCSDYHIDPRDIDFELRIYQGGEVLTENPTSETINTILDSARWHTDLILNSREA